MNFGGGGEAALLRTVSEVQTKYSNIFTHKKIGATHQYFKM
jgi:hypothetical protein